MVPNIATPMMSPAAVESAKLRSANSVMGISGCGDRNSTSTNAAAQGQDTYAREWWAGIGAETREVMSSWTFDSRADLEAVLRLEFERGVADAWLAEHPAATSLSYGYLLHVWR